MGPQCQKHLWSRATKRVGLSTSKSLQESIDESYTPMDGPDILAHLRAVWAVCCLGFAAFLLSGEFTCPSVGAYDSSMLSWGDLLVDSHTSPTLLVVQLHHSKTDVFGTGVSLYVGATGSPNCPVAAVPAYMSVRPAGSGPFFMERDGRPLSWPALVAGIRRALVSAGVDVSHFSGHSFRIGTATTAAHFAFYFLVSSHFGSSACR